MAGKRKDAGSEAVLTFRLPRELHQRLVEASVGRSVSEEMRRRLEASFVSQLVDTETNQLFDAIAAIAGSLVDQELKWHENPTGFAIMTEALKIVLEAFRPSGQPEGEIDLAVGVLAGYGLHELPDERANRAVRALDKTEPKDA
jgi:hypothetical protein